MATWLELKDSKEKVELFLRNPPCSAFERDAVARLERIIKCIQSQGGNLVENFMGDFVGEQNLNTGQFVSQPGCSIVFLPTAVAKHGGCESGKG